MSRDLTGRVVLVTGVTAGIGRATAGRLLAAGARVVGCSRDGDRLQTVAGLLPGLVPVPCDVRDAGQRAGLVETALARFGRIDALVNNAGLGYVGAVVDMTSQDVERVVGTNTTAVIDLTRMVLPGMLERRDGDVLVVSSSAVWATVPPLTVYSASKHGVNGFVVGLRREVAPHGVRVHSVNPGFVATEFLARALGQHPVEGDPDVRSSPGIDPDRVARTVRRQLEQSRPRTVAVPRYMGLGRLLSLPPLSVGVDLAVRAGSERLERLGREIAHSHTRV
jgi:NAD(P)-dependent dehydrogenase (short-subunit alcohol dehydrogenase family)